MTPTTINSKFSLLSDFSMEGCRFRVSFSRMLKFYAISYVELFVFCPKAERVKKNIAGLGNSIKGLNFLPFVMVKVKL